MEGTMCIKYIMCIVCREGESVYGYGKYQLPYLIVIHMVVSSKHYHWLTGVRTTTVADSSILIGDIRTFEP
jgi:hypothetical protein